ncbi:MAG TPA: DUF1707 and DUF4190 domain-containing protein [Streptosporangiaceae bacterium]|jgi:hypothetical protein|nr:DUF1707 and DUF4190 domain-containing protein [Streptosporangiaceae bacterium]
MTAGSYGSMRATDADRDGVHTLLQSAYADGRLTWDEFDARSTTLMKAKTYDELGALTADLRQPVPYRPGMNPAVLPRTNQMAVASLVCGFCQIFLWFVAGVPAIVFGHVAHRQIRQTGEAGSGMATAGLIMGYIGVLGPIIAFIAALVAFRPG